MNEKELFFKEFNEGLHRLGRLMMVAAVVLLTAVPFVVGAVNGVAPDFGGFLAGFAKVGLIYIPVAIVEFLVYTPMLGAGGGYLAFITGNLINMKIPCAMNARDLVDAKTGTPENEIISTLSIATSSLVTILVLAAGVVALIPLQPILQAPALQPAFDNVVPALFGAMAYKYYRGNLKIAALPLLTMALLFILVPSLAGSTSFMVLPSGAIAIGVAFLLHKKGSAK